MMLNYISLLSSLSFFNKTNKHLNIPNWRIQFHERIFAREIWNVLIIQFYSSISSFFILMELFFRLYFFSLSFIYIISYFCTIIAKILKIDIGNWRRIHSCVYTELIINFNFQQISNSRVDIFDLLELWRSLRDVVCPVYRCNKSHSMFK